MNWWAVALAVGGYVLGFVTDIGKDYFKESLAERRRERKAEQRFSRILQAMPDLMRELQAHFEQHEHAREFVVLPDTTVIYQDDTPSTKFRCYKDRHSGLTDKLATLVDAGYIRDANSKSSSPIYRMTEEFIEFVRKS